MGLAYLVKASLGSVFWYYVKRIMPLFLNEEFLMKNEGGMEPSNR